MTKKTSRYQSISKQLNQWKHEFKNVEWTPYVIFHSVYQTLSNIWIFLLALGVLFSSLILGFGIGYFAGLVRDTPIKNETELKKSLYEMNESTTVYFGTGESLGSLNADLQRQVVKYKDISPHIIEALIATEDENFYKHKGIVPKAFIRASAQEVFNSQTSSGGSTLTQQLIKNQLLTNETSFERKAKEMLLSFRVEKTLSKQEIIEAYLNVVSFGRNTNGQNVAGIEAASRGMFGKHANQLNIAQSAYLAGLPQNPYAYTPFLNNGKLKEKKYLQAGLDRQRYVLLRMMQEHKISKAEYDKALKFDVIKSLKTKVSVPSEKYPFLTEEIERRAVDILKYHFAELDNVSKSELDETPILNDKYRALANDALRNKGYVIDTTINKKMFDIMDQIKDNPYYYSYNRDGEINGKQTSMQHEVGVMLKENKTGKILAFIGGRNHKKSQNNHATQTKRSPGSTMKPLLAYGPAVEYGVVAPETMLLDRKFDYNGYSPENYARMEYNQVTTRIALENSFNLSTLRLYSSIMDREPWQFLEKMHMNIPDTEKGNLSLPLGATDITLEDDVDGFSVFANKGNYQESYLIESIKSRDGKVIYQHQARPERVFSEETAYIMTDMLRGVLDTGSAYQIKGTFQYQQDWAGKTGTAQDATDSLFIGYNPDVTMGIWMGYDKPTTFDEENHYQLRMWRDIVNSITAVSPKQMGVGETFTQPSGVTKESICQITNSKSGNCDKNESTAESLVWNKTDLSTKKIDDTKVLNRLGQILDSNTKEKITPSKSITKTQNEVSGTKSKDNKDDKNNKDNKDKNNNSSNNNSKNSNNNGSTTYYWSTN